MSTSPSLPRSFLTLWLGQTLSLVGTNAAGMGVGIVAFLETGSLAWMAALMLATRLPGLLASPRAGALVDRWSTKAVLLVADSAAGVTTFVVLALHLFGQLELWHLLVLAAVGSVANAYQEPAYQASVPRLVSIEVLPRAQGMLQLAPAAGMLAGPAIAGVVVVTAGIGGVLVLDVITFLAAAFATWSVAIPSASSNDADSPVGSSSPAETDNRAVRRSTLIEVWHHLANGRRRGVRRLVVWAALVNFAVAAVNLLLPPLLLTQTSEAVAGLVLSVGGLAMLASSAVVSARGLPERRVSAVVVAIGAVGVGVVLLGLRPDLPLVVIGVVITLGAVPFLGAAAGVIYQTEVEQAWQGRLMAFRRVVAESLMLPAALVVTPLVDWLAEPTMQPGGAGAEFLGWALGVGPGRGIGLVLVVAGLVVLVVAAAMSRDLGLRALDRPGPSATVEPVAASSPT